MGIRTFTIGRGEGCEIQLVDDSVSRRHAELVIGESGVLYLTDCGSSFGTFRVNGSDWEAIKQCYVKPGERLCFGEYETTVAVLLEIARRPENFGGDESKKGSVTGDEDKRPSGRVRRDPISGEVVSD